MRRLQRSRTPKSRLHCRISRAQCVARLLRRVPIGTRAHHQTRVLMRKLWFPDAQALVLTAATRSVWLDHLSLPTHPDRQLGADSGEIVGITTNPTNLRESNRCARDLALSR